MSYSDDDALGFKRPPRWAQFKPGQSGNPKGRPKKANKEQPSKAKIGPSELDEIFRAQLDRTVTVSEGGKPKNMKIREVISQAQINAASKGNVFAQREVLKETRQLELRDAERARALAERQEAERLEEIAVYKHMILYKAQRETEWAQAAALGSEPDDILLNPRQQRWTIRGPASEACLPFFNWCRAERDYLFAYSILEDRLAKKGSYDLYVSLDEL
jgi:hypothetical protein